MWSVARGGSSCAVSTLQVAARIPDSSAHSWRLEWKAADVPAHYLEGIGHYALPDWWGAVSDRVYYGHWHDTKTFAACRSSESPTPWRPDDAPGFVAGELAVAIGDDESDELEFPWGVIGYGERWFTAWKLPVRREDEEVFVSWATPEITRSWSRNDGLLRGFRSILRGVADESGARWAPACWRGRAG